MKLFRRYLPSLVVVAFVWIGPGRHLSAQQAAKTDQSELRGEVLPSKQSNTSSDGSFTGVVVKSTEKKGVVAEEPVKAIPYNPEGPRTGLKIAVGSGGGYQRNMLTTHSRHRSPKQNQLTTNPNQTQVTPTNPNSPH